MNNNYFRRFSENCEKAPSSFVMFCQDHLVSHWTHFPEILYFTIFPISVEKIQLSLKSDMINRLLYMKPDVHLWKYLAQFFLDLEIFWEKKF